MPGVIPILEISDIPIGTYSGCIYRIVMDVIARTACTASDDGIKTHQKYKIETKVILLRKRDALCLIGGDNQARRSFALAQRYFQFNLQGGYQ